MRLLKIGSMVCALLLAGALPASAHVTVAGDSAAVPGGTDAVITFRSPTESDTLSTVGLRVVLPTDTPLAGVQVLAIPGWTATTKMFTLPAPIITDDGGFASVVSEVDWTAASGAGIPPQSFGQFVILAGLLPDAPSLTFKAIQTYSDGSEVSWIDTAGPGVDPSTLEHPAPVLTLGAASTESPTAATSVAASAGPSVTAVSTASPSTSSSSTTLPTVLAIVALVLAAVAIGVAITNRRRAPSNPHPTGTP